MIENPDETYILLVEQDQQVSLEAPAVWEGTLRDGRAFRFTYNHGIAEAGLWTADGAYLGNGSDVVGDMYGNACTDREYRRALARLVRDFDAVGDAGEAPVRTRRDAAKVAMLRRVAREAEADAAEARAIVAAKDAEIARLEAIVARMRADAAAKSDGEDQ